ncbi:entericidin, EcnA/B family [Aliiroseovarius crassostreae]
MRTKSLLATCLLALVALSACETVKGASRDVHSGAEAVQNMF